MYQGCLTVHYAWDPDKAAANRTKHGVSFADAVAVFSDDLALTIADEFAAEECFVTIGNDAVGRVLVVVYTWRGTDTIRLISARKATRTERTQYEGG